MNPMTDRTTWRRLYTVGKPFWVSEQRWRASSMLLSVLLLLFVSSAVNVYLGRVAGEMMTALQKQEAHEFRWAMTHFALCHFACYTNHRLLPVSAHQACSSVA